MDQPFNEVAYAWDRKAKTYVLAAERSQRFLKGPVPWPWIEVAAKLPGKALALGIALWRLAGAVKSQTVRLSNAEVAALGIDRNSKSRALRDLERAGLITVERRPGCSPRVTIVSQ
jgi:hypothetical protein